MAPQAVIGKTLGNYNILQLLGAGGMGEVYLAQHTRIARKAAIKLLLPEISTDPQAVERFFTEARATSLIKHDSIVEILDCGTVDGRGYIIMEYLEGESLGARLARQRTFIEDLPSLVYIGTSVARALAAAHARGIVHRDLKPDNVYLANPDNGQGPVRVKILDFGIAKLTGSDKEVGTSHTRAGVLVGTPLYMSPEQCRGTATIDHRADIYSLGCILFEMLTGRVPFMSDNAGDLLIAHATVPPPSISEIEPRVPPALEQLIRRMLEKNPAARPASMSEVAEALQSWEQSPRVKQTLSLDSNGDVPAPPKPKVAATAMIDADSPEAKGPKVDKPLRTKDKDKTTRGSVRPAPAPPPTSKGPYLVVGMLVLAGLAAGAYFVLRPHIGGPSTSQGTDAGKPVVDNRSTGAGEEKQPQVPAPAGMVAIAGRSFLMGSTPAEIDAAFAFCKTVEPNCRRDIFEREQPQRTVTVDAFFMDTTEVSNEAFAAWLGSSGASVREQRKVLDGKGRLLADLHPAHGGIEASGGKLHPRADRAKLPVVQVTWWGADAYCAGQGKRLPSEAEWERAARPNKEVGGSLHFPWGGTAPECNAVTFGGGGKGACFATKGPRPVGSSPGDVTVDGVRDLGGNVGEWVRDGFVAPYGACPDEGCSNPVVAPDSADTRVIRGGDWLQAADACRSAGRSRRAPDRAEINVGFRCVK
jgi:serine/threonine protein kinase